MAMTVRISQSGQLRGIAGPPKDGKDLLTTIDEAMQEWSDAKLRELDELGR